MASTSNDATIVARFFDAMNARDFDAAAEVLADDAEIVVPDGTYTGSAFLSALGEVPMSNLPRHDFE